MPNDAEKLKQTQEQNQVNAQATKAGAKVAANAAFGPLGGKAVDLASKTKLGQDVLNKAGNQLGKGNQFRPMGMGNPFSNIGGSLNKNSNIPFSNIRKGGIMGATGLVGASQTEETSEESAEVPEDVAPSEEVGKAVKKVVKKSAPFLIFGGFGCLQVLLVLIVLLLIVLGPLFKIYQITENIKNGWNNFWEKVSNIPKCGFMSDEACEEKQEKKLYKTVTDVQKDIRGKYNVSIDTTLIMSTLTYYDISAGNDCDEDDENCTDLLDELPEDIEISTTSASNSSVLLASNDNISPTFLTATKNIKPSFIVDTVDEEIVDTSRKLVSTERVEQPVEESALDSFKVSTFDNFKVTKKIIYELAMQQVTLFIDTYEVKETYKSGEVKTKTTTTEKYELDEERYREYLPSFVKKVFYGDEEGSENKSRIATGDIFDRRDFFAYLVNDGTKSYSSSKTYAYCSGVTVVTNGVSELVSLEDYIAGVIAAEVGGFNIETKKANAIAARTFVLNRTNNCSSPIANSQSAQAYDPSRIDDVTRQAVEETEGLVLIYDEAIFSAMYDSFCYADKDCPDAVKNPDGTYTVTYTKMPNQEQHSITLSDSSYYNYIVPNGGHGFGMSQLVAAQMEKEGSNFEDILNFFYSDGVEIKQMVTYSDATYFSSVDIPTSAADLEERSNYYANKTITLAGETINLSKIYSDDTNNKGQCVWYARGRMLELIINSDMPDEEKLTRYRAVADSRGNGWQWYDDLRTLDIFEHQSDNTQPHSGSFVSWSGGVQRCYYGSDGTMGCGHVAVVESVDFENRTITISEGWKDSDWSSTSWDSVNVSTTTLTFDEIITKNRGTYYTSLNGYVYIMG